MDDNSAPLVDEGRAALFEHCPEPVIEFSPDHYVAWANPVAAGVFDTAVPGADVAAWVGATAARGLRERLKAAFAGTPVAEMCFSPSGSGRSFEGSLTPVCAADGTVMAVLLQAREVTAREEARRRTAHALEEQAALYRQMFENNTAVKLLIDAADGTIVDANPAAGEFYGYPLSRLRGLRIQQINTLSPQEVEAAMEAAERSHQRHFLFRHRLADGSVRDVEVFSGPVRVEGHEYLHSIIHDVTVRKRALAQLAVYKQLFEALPVGIYRIALDGGEGRFVEVNPALVRMLGVASERAFLDMPISRMFEEPEEMRRLMGWVEARGTVGHFEAKLCTVDGREVLANITAQKMEDAEGRTYHAGVVEDVTGRRQVEAELARSQAQMRDVADSFPEAVYQFLVAPDGSLSFPFVSEGVRRLYGLAPEADIHHAETLIAPVVEEDRPRLHPPSRETLAERPIWQAEFRIHTPEGEKWLFGRARATLPADGSVVFNGVLIDVTERVRLERELEYQATYDTLTGIYNRLKFEQMLEGELARARRYRYPLSLAMFDIDHFKRVNDNFGHASGDVALRMVADAAGEELREGDLYARWGGEEFMVLLPETDLEGAEQLAERVRVRVARASIPDVGRLTISLGVTVYRPDEPAKVLLKRVDQALYRAKSEGRDRTVAVPAPTD